MNVRPVTSSDREWIAEMITTAFGSVQIVSHGELIEDASLLDGFAVEHDGRPIGCALVNEVDGVAELVALVTTYRGAGAGTALLEAVVDHAKHEGWTAVVAHHEQRQHRRDPHVSARRLGLGRLPAPRRGRTRPAAQARDPRDRQPRHPDPPRDRVRSAALNERPSPTVRNCW